MELRSFYGTIIFRGVSCRPSPSCQLCDSKRDLNEQVDFDRKVFFAEPLFHSSAARGTSPKRMHATVLLSPRPFHVGLKFIVDNDERVTANRDVRGWSVPCVIRWFHICLTSGDPAMRSWRNRSKRGGEQCLCAEGLG
mmetsp:Transcript_28900/g.85412  ORF Transcript_28900/g.85412 Transcript_28900/m.85412 type:complete len:138 (-) Transcript_28900:511-924(-)